MDDKECFEELFIQWKKMKADEKEEYVDEMTIRKDPVFNLFWDNHNKTEPPPDPKLTFEENATKIVKKWKKLSSKDKFPFIKRLKQQNEKIFKFYFDIVKEEFKKENPDVTEEDLAAEIQKVWDDMELEEKNKYIWRYHEEKGGF